MLDLQGSYTSLWNRRSAEVFASEFVSSFSNTTQCTDEELIASKFVKSIRGIKWGYDKFHGAEVLNSTNALASRRFRLRKVFNVISSMRFTGLIFTL